MDEANKKFTLAGKEFHEGDYISIDGSTGNIYEGVIPVSYTHLDVYKRQGVGKAHKYFPLMQANDSRTAHCLAAWTQRR